MPRRGQVPQEGLIRKDDIMNFSNSSNKYFSSQEEIMFASVQDEKSLVPSFDRCLQSVTVCLTLCWVLVDVALTEPASSGISL